jgi:protein disulfide-isomerase
MRLLLSSPLLLLGVLLPLATGAKDISATEESLTIKTSAPSTDLAVDEDEYTIFNGQRVPPLKELGGDSLAQLIKNGYTLVKFYSPQCHHCVAVAPVWQTMYEFYWTSKPLPSSADSDLNDFHHYYGFDFANVNCVAFGDTCKKYEVGAYPTFKIFKDGEVVDSLTGAGDMKGLSRFVEDTLETIRPGSRVEEGPELPEVGAKIAPGFDEAAAAANVKASSSSKGEAATSKGKTSKKPNKPTSLPNSSGSSISLTAESFQNLVTMTQEPWFIKFYAPWCHHCQAMQPIWQQLGKEMKGKLNIGEVNCDVESRLCKDVHLQGYPTLLFFRGGERVEYDGLRGLGDFVSYANKAIAIGGGVRYIDATRFKELEETEEVIFVYFYDHATTREDFAALDRLTLSLIGHAVIVKTDSAVLADRFKITTWPRLLVSRDGRPTYYTALAPKDMRDFRQVLNWMQSVWLPIVPELTASNSREIMDGKLVVLGILSRDRPDEFMTGKKEIKSAAVEWMDKQTQLFQLERQELRDAKQLRIEEAEDRNDQRALRAAKNIRINMDRSDRKEVGFAWVDGVFWERWVRTTYGIDVREGEKVVINDEDVSHDSLLGDTHTNGHQNRRYWDTTITGNAIIPSRTSILETLPKVVASPPKIKAKRTISSFEQVIFDLKSAALEHPILATGLTLAVILAAGLWARRRLRRNRGGFFRLDEKDGLLGGGYNGKAD